MAMAKPLPVLRTPGRVGTGRGQRPPVLRGRHAAPLPRSPRPGALTLRVPQRAGWGRTRGARRLGGLGAPGRCAGRSWDSRLPCGSRVPGQPRRGHWAGTKARSGETSRCEVAGAAPRKGPPDYRSRTAGSGPGKRAPRRRGSMSWSAEI